MAKGERRPRNRGRVQGKKLSKTEKKEHDRKRMAAAREKRLTGESGWQKRPRAEKGEEKQGGTLPYSPLARQYDVSTPPPPCVGRPPKKAQKAQEVQARKGQGSVGNVITFGIVLAKLCGVI